MKFIWTRRTIEGKKFIMNYLRVDIFFIFIFLLQYTDCIVSLLYLDIDTRNENIYDVLRKKEIKDFSTASSEKKINFIYTLKYSHSIRIL